MFTTLNFPRRRVAGDPSSTPPLLPTRRAAKARRGAAAILGLVLMTSLLALAAMAMDFGYINVSRTELTRSADASAMAACWELYEGQTQGIPPASHETSIFATASEAASRNMINDESPELNTSDGDVRLGYYDLSQPDQFDTTDPSKFNAVQVHLRRQEGVNGKVPLFFGALTGREDQALHTTATAAMFKTISGFYAPASAEETVEILPITLDLETWKKVLAQKTSDDLCYVNGEVQSGSDGYFECNLYPKGTGSPGNRGTVDIGGANNSTSDLSRQIIHGISQQDFADMGLTELTLDANGELQLNGDTGISAGIKDELAEIVGESRVIPIFSTVSGNGNNATYTIVGFEGIRILGVKLTGPKDKKHLTVQPCPMVVRGTVLSTNGTSHSSYLFSPVMLVR